MSARLDHLVIAARTLQEGRAWLEARLGVPLQPGGEHTAFGTHNALLSLGPEAYLEVIAINPVAPAPARARWFGLDTPDIQEQLASGPKPIHWVAAVESLTPGDEVLEVSRGDYRWRLTVPLDGHLPMYGVAPSLIQWLTPAPPAALPDEGVRLVKLQLGTAHSERLRARLSALEFSSEVDVYEAPRAELSLVLDTPGGQVTL